MKSLFLTIALFTALQLVSEPGDTDGAILARCRPMLEKPEWSLENESRLQAMLNSVEDMQLWDSWFYSLSPQAQEYCRSLNLKA